MATHSSEWVTSVTPATREELRQIARWLSEQSIWKDALFLPAEPDAAWVEQSMLLIASADSIELAPVQYWAVTERATGELFGFAYDCRWDPGMEDVREIDVALPRTTRRNPRVPLEVFASVLHGLFSSGVRQAWARLRTPPGGGFDRLFSRIGTEHVHDAYVVHPATGRQVRRGYYRCTPEKFYASPWGGKMGPSPAGTKEYEAPGAGAE